VSVILNYYDLIGQPTWINVTQVQFQTVMRPDIIPPIDVYLPETAFAFAPGLTTAYLIRQQYYRSNSLLFSGRFYVNKVRHVGDSRSPDGVNWRTDCWAFYRHPNLTPSPIDPFTLKPPSAAAAPIDPFTLRPTVPNTPATPRRLAARRQRVW
jgi:hypothetical protein